MSPGDATAGLSFDPATGQPLDPPILGQIEAAGGKDHARELWVGVVLGRIGEAGTIGIGEACDHADYALTRFRGVFG